LYKVFWYARNLLGMICGANWSRLEWVECTISEEICISRSGEISRVAYPIAIRASRSGEVNGFWAT